MMRKLGVIVGAGVAVLGLGGASSPTMLAQVTGGLWEVSRSATGTDAVRLCLPEPGRLALFQHRSASCTRNVIADRGGEAVISYSCAGAGFGQSRLTMLTRRSLRIDTQGIQNGEPFSYVLHARLIGPCDPR